MENIQKEIDLLIKEFGGYWPPLSMLAAVMEEVGELSREINAEQNIKKKKGEQLDTKLILPKIGEEIADAIFALICMANYYKLDMTEELDNVIFKYRERDRTRFK